MANAKSGRTANFIAREMAADLVEMYRLAQSQPNGRYCLNPEDEYEFQTFIDGNDPELLLSSLENFAKNGTFVAKIDVEPMQIFDAFRKLRATGMTFENAIRELAKKLHKSESTIARKVRRTVKP
jgi:hypothetical protein